MRGLRFWLCCFVLGGITTLYGQDFTVDRYTADVYLKAEGYFTVEEHYDITFHYHKHGIYRDIQLVYDVETETGEREKRRIKVSKIKVPGHKYSTSGKITRDVEGYTRIKIGDKNKTVKGPMRYDISYRVDNAWLYNTQNTQFYWNLKPPNWNAEFKEMMFRIHPPEGVTLGPEDLKVYSGPMGTTTFTDEFTISWENGTFVLRSNEKLNSNYGDSVTVLLNLPPTAIAKIEPWWPFGQKYGWVFVIAALIAVFYKIWDRYGRDDKVIPVTGYYPPEKMNPALAGYLIDDMADSVDLIALIPHWGRQGIIKVEEIDKKSWFKKDDTRLYKLKPLPEGVPPYEQEMFDGLFSGRDEVDVSDLKNSFYKTMSSAKAMLREEAKPYYDPTARKMTTKVAFLYLGMLFVVTPFVLMIWNFWGALITALTCVVLFVINLLIMRKKNAKGNEALAHLKGFRNFVKLAETPRLKSLITQDPHYYEDTMSYALAFGLFEKWSKKFDGLDLQPPSWYTSTAGHHMSMHHFSKSFSKSMTSTQQTMVSSPSSSGGGGSSGGGFGGGGGGSW